MSDDEVKEFAPTGILHHHVELFLGLDDFVQLDHVWMPDFLQDLDFSCNPLYIFLIMNFVLLQDLDGHLLPSQGVLA